MAAPPEIRLKRFLHYASEEGMYEARPRRHDDYVVTNLKCITPLLTNDESGDSVILPTILKVYSDGTSITPTAVIFALAVCATQTESEKLRANTYKKVQELSLNEEDLFNFVHFCYKLSTNKGGQGLRKTVIRWYKKKTPRELAEIVAVKTKIHSLHHKDMIKLYHMKSEDRAKQAIYSYLLLGLTKMEEAFKDAADTEEILKYLKTIEKIKTTKDAAEFCDLIKKHAPKFPHQSMPPQFHQSAEVWSALFPTFSLDQVLSMTQQFFRSKLLKPSSPLSTLYIERISNEEIPSSSKIDPCKAYVELRTYEMLPRKKEYFKALKKKSEEPPASPIVVRHASESSDNSSGWDGAAVPAVNPAANPAAVVNSSIADAASKKKEDLYPTFKLNKKVVEALNKLVTRSFKSLKPTGLRFLIGVDTRNIMSNTMHVKCPFVKSMEAASLLLLSFLNAEKDKNITVTSFIESGAANTSNYRIEEITGLSSNLSIAETAQVLAAKNGAPVNMLKFFDWAVAKKKEVDVFVLLSASSILPCDPFNAMVHYSNELNKENIKLITVSLNGMCSRPRKYFKKPNMLYVNGFDDKVWQVIEAFCRNTF